ncbi:RHS repeat-associated core domain-containing protein, partial [Burkholderia sp. MSMB2041]
FASSRIDARLLSADETPNFAYVTSVAGGALCTVSVDAGTSWALADIDGRPVWAHDARGTTATWTYDVLGRPLTAEEAVAGQAPATREVWVYGEREADAQAHNLRGQCVRRYDTAGRLEWRGFHLIGEPVIESRTLLADAEGNADWAGDELAWASALESVAYTTAWTRDATGTWLTQTDAASNVQARAFDVAGRLALSGLTLAGGTAWPVLSAIDYSAPGQVLSETAGNGVVSTCAYEPETQRLVRLTVTRPAQTGRGTVLQDLQYTYDPVGNVLSMTDTVQPTTYWRNQRVDAGNTYAYDALYQLIRATGRETVNRGRQGTTLPAPIPLPNDDSVYSGYTRTYQYDRGGNFTQIAHQGAVGYTQDIVVSGRSNHALVQNARGSLTPGDVDDGTWFDPTGNQQCLLPDRVEPLGWNGRNRLQRVTLVKRSGDPDDREAYHYGSDGMRVRKCTSAWTLGTTRTAEAITLPGLTLRLTRSDDGATVKVTEALHEIRLNAGRTGARALHWESGLPPAVGNDALRFSHGDLVGSIGLELDGQADLVSREEYYPYGGTAVWSARSQTEADTKFIRYSGKEQDVTGLYDYGYRYYQPWACRWLSPDPAGTVDGLNLFRMVRNSPVTQRDLLGLLPTLQDLAKQEINKLKNFGPEHVLAYLGGVQALRGKANAHGYFSANRQITIETGKHRGKIKKGEPSNAPTVSTIAESTKKILEKRRHLPFNVEIKGSDNPVYASISLNQDISSGVFVGGGSLRSGLVGIPYRSTENPSSPALEYDIHGNELLFRSMSTDHYNGLMKTNKLQPTTETSISPAVAYSLEYSSPSNGELIQFALKPGTLKELREIGLALNKGVKLLFPDMREGGGEWMKTNAQFKVEGEQMTIQLGQGRALEIFNRNMVHYRVIKRVFNSNSTNPY